MSWNWRAVRWITCPLPRTRRCRKMSLTLHPPRPLNPATSPGHPPRTPPVPGATAPARTDAVPPFAYVLVPRTSRHPLSDWSSKLLFEPPMPVISDDVLGRRVEQYFHRSADWGPGLWVSPARSRSYQPSRAYGCRMSELFHRRGRRRGHSAGQESPLLLRGFAARRESFSAAILRFR